MRPLRALDWLNFFLADVRGGLGPHVNVFLLTQAHWSQATIGTVLAASGLIGITMHAPVGAMIDRTHAKRALLVAGVTILSVCALAIAWVPTVPVVFAADVSMAILGAVFAPTVAAITLGLVGREALAARLGRNAAIDRAGNLFIAALVGLIGWQVSQAAPFYAVPVFAVFATLATLAIPPGAIDHQRARGLDPEDPATHSRQPTPWRALLRNRPLVVLGIAAALFHFAHAPMLALVGQKLALRNPELGVGLTAAAVVVAQLTTIVMALVVTRANFIGRKPLLMISFAALPLRGALCAVSEDPVLLLGIQVLEGVAGGMFDVLLPLVLADIMRGTGHYSAARGILGTLQGIGGSSAQAVAGVLVTVWSYELAFFTLTGVAVAALLLVAVAMPETTPDEVRQSTFEE